MNYKKWYWILREHIGEDTWIDIYETHQRCNLCHQGLCDADLDFHTGEYYVED